MKTDGAEVSISWIEKAWVELEVKVAHLIWGEDLSDVVARQLSEIAGMELRVPLLMDRAAEEEALGESPLGSEHQPAVLVRGFYGEQDGLRKGFQLVSRGR